MAKFNNVNKSQAHIDLEDFLHSLRLDHTPVVHVNGREHPTAIVTVDFGAPLEQVRLTAAQNSELVSRLRRFTKDVMHSHTVHARVSSDVYNGLVYWSSI